MRTSTCRLSLLTLALAATLAVPCVGSSAHATAWSGPVARTALETSGVDLLSQAWSWFKGLWPNAGCILDPNGGCVSYAATPTVTRHAGAPYRSPAGCGLDPNGACGSNIAAPPAVAGSNRRSGAGKSATRGTERR